jgi:hypothetical protein
MLQGWYLEFLGGSSDPLPFQGRITSTSPMEACRLVAAGIRLLAVGGGRFILTCFLATISKLVPMVPMLPSPLAASLLTTLSLQRPDPKEPLGDLHNTSLGKGASSRMRHLSISGTVVVDLWLRAALETVGSTDSRTNCNQLR